MKSLLLALLLVAPGFSHAGDAGKGLSVFEEECGDCHAAKAGKNKKGPSLFGVVGRKAGTIADFGKYSDAMKNSGITWSRDKLDAYITHPKEVVSGGKMKYDGLAKASDRGDLLEFLAAQR
ncbi:MAG: cytochrome c family protein [Pseudomonadota bacterium]